MVDQNFRNFNRLFVKLFKAANKYLTMNCFFKYYVSLAEIKYFNVLIDNKSYFGQPVNTNKELMQNLRRCQENMTVQQ